MNVKHPDSELRRRAKEAKQRLLMNAYDKDELNAPKNITPQQRSIYLKLLSLNRQGETDINPIEQFADKDVMNSLSYADRQRYIMQLCADYLAMKNYIAVENKA